MPWCKPVRGVEGYFGFLYVLPFLVLSSIEESQQRSRGTGSAISDTLRSSRSEFEAVNRAVVLTLFLGLTSVGQVSFCAFVSFPAMRLMSINAIDKTLKGPPVEVLAQSEANSHV